MTESVRYGKRGVVAWLLSVIAFVLAMVIVGGITRLTESGLSMVDWRPIVGAVPPLHEAEWQQSFAAYQQTPQFQKMFPEMSLAQYKRIFFWEYVHRLIGRLVGLVFLVPFLVFALQRRFSSRFTVQLLIGFLLGGMQGLLGWYMVKSGLIDRPRVSHFRLAAHLCLAYLIIAYLFWLVLDLRGTKSRARASLPVRLLARGAAAAICLQIVYGAFVAGMRAGIGYNTFPKMGERWIADLVGAMDPWWTNLFYSHATLQFIHRWLGILALLLITWFWLLERAGSDANRRRAAHWLFAVVMLQVMLGIYTLVNVVPIGAAVSHQAGAALLLLAMINVLHLHHAAAVSAGNR